MSQPNSGFLSALLARLAARPADRRAQPVRGDATAMYGVHRPGQPHPQSHARLGIQRFEDGSSGIMTPFGMVPLPGDNHR